MSNKIHTYKAGAVSADSNGTTDAPHSAREATHTASAISSVISDAKQPEHSADTDENTASQSPDTSTEPSKATADGVTTIDTGQKTPKPPVDNEDTSKNRKGNPRRLPPGGLRGMVEDWLGHHAGEEFSPSAIGNALGRSAGAVANALDKLVADGYAVQTQNKPKRFTAKASDELVARN